MPRTLLLAALCFGTFGGSALADPLTISDIIGGWTSYTGGSNVAVTNSPDQGVDTIRWGDSNMPESGYDFTPGADIVGVL